MLKYHIQTVELSSSQATISFNSIPQDFSDLYVLYSTRSVADNPYITWTGFTVRANGIASGYSGRMLEGNGASGYSQTNNSDAYWDYAASPDSATTANTFSNGSIYIPNYSGFTAKIYSMDRVTENNATQSSQLIYAGLLNSTAPITSLAFTEGTSNFSIGTSISLYGVRRGDSGQLSPAYGGTVTTSGGYTIHTFNSSGTFFAIRDLSVECLVVAGGGGAGANQSGGGGAGGYISSSLNLAPFGYSVTVGSGGSGFTGPTTQQGIDGSSSSFASLVSIGGGGGGSSDGGFPLGNGRSGGSGSGGASSGITHGTGGAGIAGQGTNGGKGVYDSGGYRTGGGGGGSSSAGADGVNLGNGGNGGAGTVSSITGSAVARAGGGGGFPNGVGVAGAGSGAPLGNSAGGSASQNSGSGGGGAGYTSTSGNGGSGVVIIRYLTP